MIVGLPGFEPGMTRLATLAPSDTFLIPPLYYRFASFSHVLSVLENVNNKITNKKKEIKIVKLKLEEQVQEKIENLTKEEVAHAQIIS